MAFKKRAAAIVVVLIAALVVLLVVFGIDTWRDRPNPTAQQPLPTAAGSAATPAR